MDLYKSAPFSVNVSICIEHFLKGLVFCRMFILAKI